MKYQPLIVLGLSTLFMSSAFANDSMPGKALHADANCLKCHATQAYNPTKTPSFPKLVAAVTYCNENLNSGWFEDEITHVAEYLNETYYKHPK